MRTRRPSSASSRAPCTRRALPGGWLADNWLGQQKAVWYGSILIALGHLSIALSAFMGNNLFFIGLMFIVLGSGLFKTLHLGDGRYAV